MMCHNKVTYFDSGKLAMDKSKKRKVSDENNISLMRGRKNP